MFWTSPRGAFKAKSPPAWLRHSLTFAERHTALRRIQTLVLFSDDTPTRGSDRIAELTKLSRQAFGAVEGLNPSAPYAQENWANSNAIVENVPLPHGESGTTLDRTCVVRPPTHGLITLSARNLVPAQFFAGRMGVHLSRLRHDIWPAAIHQMVLAHELGHLWRLICCHKLMTTPREEHLCDVFSVRACRRNNNPFSGNLLVHYRNIANLMSPFGEDEIKYWNFVAAKPPTTSYSEKLKAFVEVKARAAGLIFNPQNPPTLYGLMIGQDGEALRQRYETQDDGEKKLRTLAETHKTRPYAFRYSGLLANQILTSVKFMAPDLRL